jgi:ribosomal protein S18 acetylase RimI-like enzyme
MTAAMADQEPVDREQLMAALLLAFSTDPGMRWLFPDTDRYRIAFPELIALAGATGFAAGTAEVASGGRAAAVWAPPRDGGDSEDGGAYLALFQRHIDPARLDTVLEWGARVGAHHPDGAHWYLVAIGVDPMWQGRGHGSALLRTGLERCDRDNLPAYLEASDPRNAALYTRHGFRVLDEIQVADSPPLWPMWREAV